MLKDYVIVDLETTGLSPKLDKIIEIGAIKIRDGKEEARFETFVNPARAIPERITGVTGINDMMVADAPYIEDVIGEFILFIEDLPLLGHNIAFDYSFLKVNAVNNKYKFDKLGIDTLKLARVYLSELESKRLEFLCDYFGIVDENHHRAINDAFVTGELYKVLCEKFDDDSKPYELVYQAKKQGPVTERQKKYLTDLVRYHKIIIDYDINKLTKSEASRIIDKTILEYGNIRTTSF